MKESVSDVILVGYSGHAYVVADILIQNGVKIKGYLDKAKKDINPFKLEYLGVDDTWMDDFAPCGFIVAIGDNNIRGKIYDSFKKKLIQLINVIHSSSVISNTVIIGSGLMIMPNVVVNSFARIGDGVILNSNCTVEHECLIGNYVHIAPGAVLAGNVTVGDYTFIGAGAVVKQGVRIGKNVVIGAGCVVLNDVEDNQVVIGNPGRLMK
ncbi:acetyltransferase [Solitalea sp. MAHUQ-68]|uniref:Acetyltransferase n=1 Tax=Solitalea agri TaxID=2953739 RepID=A0A9X2JD12_9SPHI|nr:acetyltransferase [Solitalea agri]MCO4293109.1 acetyltransferase [Solitalea agri]